jgi:hypothetical protein
VRDPTAARVKMTDAVEKVGRESPSVGTLG